MSEVLQLVKPLDSYDRSSDPDLEAFERDLNIGTYFGWHEEFDRRVRRIPINTWMCTDTNVGIYAYFFDGEFVALSFQSARKSDINIKWMYTDAARRVREFIRSLRDQDDEIDVKLIVRDEGLDDWWITKRV